ncbi:MAG: DUF262 domain-containing protein [Chitinophagales bacterium]|nr:DUF262 domain-containing protein [Chitinophagales bacterium]
MLSANKEKLQSFLMGSNQFVIPFFQRSYVWKSEDWAELFENIKEEYDQIINGDNTSEHFIGTIIIKQRESERVGSLEYDLIDGQQRLTTICILLRAFYDISEDANLKNWIKTLLVFTDSYGQENIRILHSRVDRDYFQNILKDSDNNNALWKDFASFELNELERKLDNFNRIMGAYLYFRHRIERELNTQDIRQYITIILEKLPVIHMALSKNDDVQQIFDTINSLGVKLTTAELLKNYLYAKPKVIDYYDEYWHSVFEADEDTIKFWEAERTSGRVRRTTVELFLYSYLIILTESIVKMEALFKEYREYLKDKKEAELVSFAKDVHEYALVYQQLPDGENLAEISFNEHEKRFFHLIREFEITTIFPLILYIFKQVTEAQERIQILRVIESYLTRRTVCKLTTKNYNNLFFSLLSETKKMGTITAQKMKEKLLSYTEDTNRFPTDEELKNAFETSALINQYSREVLYCIALYQLDHTYADQGKLNFDGFSVEHMMPKKWRIHWSNITDEDDEEFRDYKLRTMGNLTLVRGSLNSAMKHSGWSVKKEFLRRYSTLRQTTDYLGLDDWNEETIATRANHLYEAALQIWPR